MEQEEQYDTLIPIQEELSERPIHRICCFQCSNEDIFLSVYIVVLCAILFGGFIFIIVWMIYKATA